MDQNTQPDNDILFCIENHSLDPNLSNRYIVAKKIKGSAEPKIMVNLWKRAGDRAKPDTPLCEHVLSGEILKDWVINERNPDSSIFCPTCEEDEKRTQLKLIPIQIKDSYLFASRDVRISDTQTVSILDDEEEWNENTTLSLNRPLRMISFRRRKGKRSKNFVKDLLNTEEVINAFQRGDKLQTVIREFDSVDDKCPEGTAIEIKSTPHSSKTVPLGEGASGIVFTAKLEHEFGTGLSGTLVALKRMDEPLILDESTLTVSIHAGKGLEQMKIHTYSEYLHETIISSLMDRFVRPTSDKAFKAFACPHFPLFYGFFTCEGGSQPDPYSREGYSIIELFDGNFPSFFDTQSTPSLLKFGTFFREMGKIAIGPLQSKQSKGESPFSQPHASYTLRYIYFQVLFSIVKAQEEYNFMHNDLHSENVMFKKIGKGNEWHKQRLDQAKEFGYTMKKGGANSEDVFFVLKNMGFLTMITDFGWSSVFLKDNNIVLREEFVSKQHRQRYKDGGGYQSIFVEGYDIAYFTLTFIYFLRYLILAQANIGREKEWNKVETDEILRFAKEISHDLLHSMDKKAAPLDSFDKALDSKTTVQEVKEFIEKYKFVDGSSLYTKKFRPDSLWSDKIRPRWILTNGETIKLFRSDSMGKSAELVEMASF